MALIFPGILLAVIFGPHAGLQKWQQIDFVSPTVEKIVASEMGCIHVNTNTACGSGNLTPGSASDRRRDLAPPPQAKLEAQRLSLLQLSLTSQQV